MSISPDILSGPVDRYNGVLIDTNLANIASDRFKHQLEKSLTHWTSNSFKTIWFKVHLKHSDYVPILAENGFDFHHAKAGFVMMAKWLPTDLSANLPVYSHTMVGVGGLVVNDKDQILTIVEKQAIIPGSWKLPGGYVEPDEHFVDAAIREVKEETGIQTKFDRLVCFRHASGRPNFSFGCSDLYVVISLTPETSVISNCEREIAASQWMDFKEYLEHPQVHESNRRFLRTLIEYRKKGIKINCHEHIHEILKRDYNIYSADVEPTS